MLFREREVQHRAVWGVWLIAAIWKAYYLVLGRRFKLLSLVNVLRDFGQ